VARRLLIARSDDDTFYNLQNLSGTCIPELVHGQVTIIFVVSVDLFVCAEFFSAVFDPVLIKLGHMLCVWV